MTCITYPAVHPELVVPAEFFEAQVNRYTNPKDTVFYIGDAHFENIVSATINHGRKVFVEGGRATGYIS